MNERLFLNRDELFELTGKKTRPAQAKVLDAMTIPHATNGLGELVVLRKAVEKKLSVNDPRTPAEEGTGELDQSWLEQKRKRKSQHERESQRAALPPARVPKARLTLLRRPE
jgi:ribosome biogenesis protein Tsr3